MATRDFSQEYKEVKALHLSVFQPTTNESIDKARQYKKYISHFIDVLDTLKITQEDSRYGLLKLHDYNLINKAEKAVKDDQVSNVSGKFNKLLKKLDIYLEVQKLRDSARQKLREVRQRENQPAADVLITIVDYFEEAEWDDASNKDEQIRSILLNALRNNEVRKQWCFSNKNPSTDFSNCRVSKPIGGRQTTILSS